MDENARQIAKALSLYAEFKRIPEADAEATIKATPEDQFAADMTALEEHMSAVGWAPTTRRQYLWRLRRMSGGLTLCPPRKRMIRRTRNEQWYLDMRDCKALTSAAHLLGLTEPILLAEGLKHLAEQHRGAKRQRLLTAARQIARVEEL